MRRTLLAAAMLGLLGATGTTCFVLPRLPDWHAEYPEGPAAFDWRVEPDDQRSVCPDDPFFLTNKATLRAWLWLYVPQGFFGTIAPTVVPGGDRALIPVSGPYPNLTQRGWWSRATGQWLYTDMLVRRVRPAEGVPGAFLYDYDVIGHRTWCDAVRCYGIWIETVEGTFPALAHLITSGYWYPGTSVGCWNQWQTGAPTCVRETDGDDVTDPCYIFQFDVHP